MSLSTELVSQFAKLVKSEPPKQTETTMQGEIVEYEGSKWVRLDGSDRLTPISSTADTQNGDKVTVLIKDHTATVTGNLTSPAARTDDVKEVANKVTEFEIVSAYKVTAEELEAINATIENLKVKIANIDELNAVYAEIETLQAKFATMDSITAKEAEILDAEIESLRAKFGEFEDLSTEDFEAINAEIDNLKGYTADFTYVSADVLAALKADINNLDVKKLTVDFANIDFANIDKANIYELYATSGIIQNITSEDGVFTGQLVGVTIKGDVIEGGTIVADKLVVKGEDGLYYKLNTDGESTEVEQTEYNSLNGSVITAKSITATKISVSDLVAFDATIGGFNITENSIFSDVKDSEGNTTRGIYMDTDGQINFGDESNFIKYYRDEDGTYKLAISAESILYALNGKPYNIADLGVIGEYVHIGTFEGEPCIELGEKDSDFKLIITNTRILFMEGSSTPAHITNESLHITKAVIEEEIQQGEFVWKVRQNGNMGLMWRGEA